MFTKDKKGLELAISTLILIILGIFVLIGLIAILVMGLDDFKMYIGAIFGSDIQQARKMCELQCKLENNYDFCCQEKMIRNNQIISCQNEILRTECGLDCPSVNCGDF